MEKLTIGLFGFGVVGEGIYKVLSQKQNLGCTIKKIAIKNPNKNRNAPASLFTNKANDIINDEDINLIVELIDDADAAFNIVCDAMNKGKSVVSANKKMIATHHLKLIELSKKNNVSFLYEAAVCGSVPIIRNLEEYFDNDLLIYIQGIVNGSTNYILSKMKTDNVSYENALSAAKENGFAESDPTLDVEGIDAAYKISIITLHAFGKYIKTKDVIRKGITSLKENDFQYAKEKGFVIKLIAKSILNKNGDLINISVLPTFIEKNNTLGNTNNEFNGLLIGSSLADEQFLYGKGAGRYPTSSAVLSDISAIKYGYRYEYKKGIKSNTQYSADSVKCYISFNREIAFDRSVFEKINEEYLCEDKRYIIGHLKPELVKDTQLFEDKRISLICFN